MDKLEKYKIIKSLGKGVFGQVFLVEKNGKKYAMKIEKILEKEIRKNMKYPIWREIEFAKNIASKNPDFFMTIKDYFIIKNCNIKIAYGEKLENLPSDAATKLKERRDSKYCSVKIYSLVKNVIANVINKLNMKQVYSIIIQLAYAIYILNSNGYVHGDLHLNNIGIIKAKKEFVKIFDRKIPTYGYQINIIDFGMVLNKKYKLGKSLFSGTENQQLKYLLQNELPIVLYDCMTNRLDLFLKILRKAKTINYEKIRNVFMKSDEKLIVEKITKDLYWQVELYILLFPEKFQKLALGNKFKKIDKPIIRVNLEDIYFLLGALPIRNPDDIKIIIKYLFNKL